MSCMMDDSFFLNRFVSIWCPTAILLFTLYIFLRILCHDVALFGYSKHQLSLTTSLFPLHPGSVISGRKFMEETLLLPCSIERGFTVEQRNFYLTKLENWIISMFWRMCKRSVENPATTGPICLMFVTAWETTQPHYHNSVYTRVSVMRFASNYCIKWMSKDETICEIMWI